jgi:hypothetical protein
MHQPLPAADKEDDQPHPEQPARIIKVFKKLEGESRTGLSRVEWMLTRQRYRSGWTDGEDGEGRGTRGSSAGD